MTNYNRKLSLRKKPKSQKNILIPAIFIIPVCFYIMIYYLEYVYILSYQNNLKIRKTGILTDTPIFKLINERFDSFLENQIRLSNQILENTKDKIISTIGYLPLIFTVSSLFLYKDVDRTNLYKNVKFILFLVIGLLLGLVIEGLIYGLRSFKSAIYVFAKRTIIFIFTLNFMNFNGLLGAIFFILYIIYTLVYDVYHHHKSFTRLSTHGDKLKFNNLPTKILNLIDKYNLIDNLKIKFYSSSTNAKNRQSFNLKFILFLFKGYQLETNFLIFSLIHEIGHIANNHVFIGMFVAQIPTFLFNILVLSFIIHSDKKNGSILSRLLVLLALTQSSMICFYPIFVMIKNFVSRRFEMIADKFTLEYEDDKIRLARGIITLMIDGDSILSHSLLYKIMFSDYPDTIERLAMILD